MSRQTGAALPPLPAYDNCLISACLKKHFTKARSSTTATDYTVSKNIALVKKELEIINKNTGIEMSYAYLAAMEHSLPDTSFRYVVIYRNDVPVLFGYFQLFTLTSQNFSFDKNKGFVKGIFRFFLDLKKAKVLISGNALRTDTPCCCFSNAELNNDEATEILAAVGEKIAADEHATALLLKDITVSTRMHKWLAGLGYQSPWTDIVMTMDLRPEWTCIESYIAALSRKYKTRANKILAAREGLEIRELSQPDIAHHSKDIHDLFSQVADNQSFVLNQPAIGHFHELKNIYGNQFEVIGFFHERKLVAFYSAFTSGDVYDIYYAGFDYKHNTDFQLYFNILFSGLERAIAQRKKQLKFGRTSFDAKASIGAKPVEMDYLIKTVNIHKVATQWFINYFSTMEDGKWKLRNPLK